MKYNKRALGERWEITLWHTHSVMRQPSTIWKIWATIHKGLPHTPEVLLSLDSWRRNEPSFKHTDKRSNLNICCWTFIVTKSEELSAVLIRDVALDVKVALCTWHGCPFMTQIRVNMKSDLAVFLFWAIHWSHAIKKINYLMNYTKQQCMKAHFWHIRGKKTIILSYFIMIKKSHNYEIQRKNYGIYSHLCVEACFRHWIKKINK